MHDPKKGMQRLSALIHGKRTNISDAMCAILDNADFDGKNIYGKSNKPSKVNRITKNLNINENLRRYSNLT